MEFQLQHQSFQEYSGLISFTLGLTGLLSLQSILKEISPEYLLEGLMLKLKLQYLGHLMQRTDSLQRSRFWEQLKVGGEWDDRG